MSIKIKNIKLNKDNFIFGIDEKIELSFEIVSDKEKTINELNIFYGYNFYGKDQKHNAFQGKIEKRNINIVSMGDNKFSYIIPIKFFNFKSNSNYSSIEIKNYINIQIKNGFLSRSILEEIEPKIYFDSDLYGIKYLYVNQDIDLGTDSIDKIENLILKIDDEKYKNIKDNIDKLQKEINEIEDKITVNNEENKWDKLDDLYKRINNLEKEKQNLFIVKENEKNNFKKLIDEKKKILEKIELIDENDTQEFLNLSNRFKKIKYKIYKTFSSKDEKQYNSLLETYFSGLGESKNNKTEINHISEKIDISEKIKNNSSDYQIIKKHFKGILTGKMYEIVEENSISADFIHKEIFEKLKGNLIINIFTKLVNSKVYNFIYKYIFILPVIGFLLVLFEDLVSKYINFDFKFAFIFFIFPIVFLIFSKIFELVFQNIINNAIYKYKLKDKKTLENNLENKLLNGTLDIYDIFENLDLKIDNSMIDYNFKVLLELNVGTYYTEGKSTYYENTDIYSLDLFNSTGKGNFNLSNIKLLENNYTKLKNILVNSNSNKATEIYYKIICNFDSSYLPDLNLEKKLYLHFKNIT